MVLCAWYVHPHFPYLVCLKVPKEEKLPSLIGVPLNVRSIKSSQSVHFVYSCLLAGRAQSSKVSLDFEYKVLRRKLIFIS